MNLENITNYQTVSAKDEALLAAVAVVLVEHPRATLKDIALEIGVSKATLYRYCQTREQLIQRVMDQTLKSMTEAIIESELETVPVDIALRKLIESHYARREYTAFLLFYFKDAKTEQHIEDDWSERLDRFFLKGQQQGFFRIDTSAAELSEILIGIIISLVDAERRGRVARGVLATLTERIFLEGAKA